MLKIRLIAVVIVRDGQVVQSVRFKHTNVIHYDPVHAIEAFNKWAIDEIVILNVSRESEGRDLFADTVANISRHCYVPLSAGGWITDEVYAQRLLRSGADKLVLNTAFSDAPDLIKTLSNRYGRQCIVASIDGKRDENNDIQVYVDRGLYATGINPVDWARNVEMMGAGEILFNSIDHDGARKGYDLETLAHICNSVTVPVIAFGGIFTWKQMVLGVEAGASAVAAANIFHYTEHSTYKAKRFLHESGVQVRWESLL